MNFVRPNQSELRAVASLLTQTHDPAGRFDDYTTPALLGLLDYHGVTLLADHYHTLPQRLKPLILQRKAMMVANDALKRRELIQLFNAFALAQLSQCVLFKGSALAYTVYAKPWLRPRSDSDILIKPEQRHAFDAVFMALGYTKQFAIEGKYVSYQSTYSKKLVGKSAINIDLHWRINNRQILAQSFDAEELCRQGHALNQLSDNITVPSNVHCLLISSLHRLGHHHNEERLTWLYDIHLLANSFNAHSWQQLVEQARTKKLSAITLDALNHCAQLLNTAIPSVALKQLMSNANKPEPSQLFLQRDLPERHLFWRDLNAMPSRRARVGLLIETFIPKPAYIRQQMKTRFALWGYLKRAVRGLKRVYK